MRHVRGEVERCVRAGVCEVAGAAACERDGLGDAVLEAHRHEPARANRCGRVQRAAIRALDDARVCGIREVVAQARAVRCFGKRNGRGDAAQRGVFFGEPARTIVPPAQRRKHAVETHAFQRGHVMTRKPWCGREKTHGRHARTRLPDQTPPHRSRHAMRRVETKAAHARFAQRDQLLRPPVHERTFAACGARAEIRVGNVVVTMTVTRVEPRFLGLEWMKPVGVSGEQRTVCGHAIDREIGEQREAVFACGIGEFAQCFRGGLHRVENGMKARVIADDQRMSGPAWLEQSADQDVVEPERGGMGELGRPRFEWPDKNGVSEVDTRRIGVGKFHRSYPSFFVRCGCTACDHNACWASREASPRTARGRARTRQM
ncbi:protein of unknown function [Paraburkholderia kururiensis]